MTTATVPCSCCRGKGERHVSAEYAETLAALRRLGRATCHELATAMGCADSGTLIHKRIARLEEWKLVKRTIHKLPKGETDPRKRAWVFEVA